MMSYNRILIIQLKHLGDILLTTPVISALKHAWPRATVSALVPGVWRPCSLNIPASGKS